MHVGGVIVGIVAAGCGRVGFDPHSADAALGGDASPDAWVCASPYVMLAGSCYRVEPTPATWLVAEQQCESEGSHLINVADIDEHFVLHTLLGDAGVASGWVGFTDRVTEGTFLWVTPGGLDPMTDICFLGGRPNGAAADCVIQDGTNSCPDWTIVDCNVARPFVCERDAVQVDPATY